MATKRYTSDLPCHPGGYVRDDLEARGLTSIELAEELGKSRQSVRALLNGRARLNVETALRLEALWGVSAETWRNLQQTFDLVNARNRQVPA